MPHDRSTAANGSLPGDSRRGSGSTFTYPQVGREKGTDRHSSLHSPGHSPKDSLRNPSSSTSACPLRVREPRLSATVGVAATTTAAAADVEQLP